jgi:hypothetical protein
MLKRSIKPLALAALTAATLSVALVEQAHAVNPVSYIAYYPAHTFYEAQNGAKRVRFYADVNLDEVAVDVTSVTSLTKFTIQGWFKCLGQDSVIVEENGDSPLTAIDDARVDCPFYTRGELQQSGVGIPPF